jgi:predicted aconitase
MTTKTMTTTSALVALQEAADRIAALRDMTDDADKRKALLAALAATKQARNLVRRAAVSTLARDVWGDLPGAKFYTPEQRAARRYERIASARKPSIFDD